MKKATENLSCGGSFLPHKKHAPQKTRSEPKTDIVTLPTGEYEVLVVGPQPGDPIRYSRGEDSLNEELERIQTAYQRLLQQNH